ncbi:DUF4450 domain-containing protein [Plebeiibacterium sediminum]|uniref:DUF4450 domain-containing protein n=1 Tax=Plebeiibacterium sediminum TaxID=2992112 RepID=A0AAE3M4I2_9BACT|nr:DUF4450 domain-containing protein [Plebeiobacterium sediminum]MCW3786878.1 DUF4450 domain-containing protein [Plebeiobacterium sediminum]
MEIKLRVIKFSMFIAFCLFIGQNAFAQNPDWSMLAPELGGTLRLGVANGNSSKWFADFKTIKEKAQEYEVIFTLKDEILGKGEIKCHIKALKDSKGAVIKLTSKNTPEDIKLIWTYGGASNDTKAEKWNSVLEPEDCYKNVFSIEGNSFTLYYGTSRKLRVLEALVPPGEEPKLADAKQQESPLQLLNSGKKTDAQVVASESQLIDDVDLYFCFYFLNPKADYNYFMLPKLFENRSYVVNKQTEWMKSTPD